MRPMLLGLWAIIASSIVAVIALATVWNYQRSSSARTNLNELLARQLDPFQHDIQQLFQDYERQLDTAFEAFDLSSPSSIAELERHPLVGTLVLVTNPGPQGRLIYPDLERVALADRSLITDALVWIRDSNLPALNSALNNSQPQPLNVPTQKAGPVARNAAPQSSTDTANSVDSSAQKVTSLRQVMKDYIASNASQSVASNPSNVTNANGMLAGNSADSNWTTWYHQRGLVLAYWHAPKDDTLAMVIVPRGRWLADLVASLPDSQTSRQDALLQLVDVEGQTVTQWGAWNDEISDKADAELPVSDPLQGWRLRITLTDAARDRSLSAQGAWLAYLAALGFSLAIGLTGVLLTLNLNRQLRLAEQQVSFVNQVSHELRTPLTNIRMYAELASENLNLDEEPAPPAVIQQLNVIEGESVRLCRLIDNVLSYARSTHGRLQLKPERSVDIDRLIREVLSTFALPLEEAGMLVTYESKDLRPFTLDRGACEQILVNLIGNAVKYARSGKSLRIEAQCQANRLKIRVQDDGPGIPLRARKRIFQPFARISNRLEDPAGTGIGLSIARRLARQHGGDVTLESQAIGCCFLVVLDELH